MIIDHIGIAVKDLQAGIDQWQNLFGYKQITKVVENSRQKVKVVFLSKPDSTLIKLIEPTDNTSPVYTFTKRGGGLHHLCFKCGDIDKQLDILSERKLRILSYPQPGEAFENDKIAFVFAGNGLNIELIDTDKKAGLI